MARVQRHDFRFVVEGFTLTTEQRDEVAKAVEEAGLAALARVSRGQLPSYTSVDTSLIKNIDWIGRYLRSLQAREALENAQRAVPQAQAQATPRATRTRAAAKG